MPRAPLPPTALRPSPDISPASCLPLDLPSFAVLLITTLLRALGCTTLDLLYLLFIVLTEQSSTTNRPSTLTVSACRNDFVLHLQFTPTSSSRPLESSLPPCLHFLNARSVSMSLRLGSGLLSIFTRSVYVSAASAYLRTGTDAACLTFSDISGLCLLPSVLPILSITPLHFPHSSRALNPHAYTPRAHLLTNLRVAEGESTCRRRTRNLRLSSAVEVPFPSSNPREETTLNWSYCRSPISTPVLLIQNNRS